MKQWIQNVGTTLFSLVIIYPSILASAEDGTVPQRTPHVDSVTETWARFRGPNGSGRSESSAPLPADWSNERSIRWKSPAPRGSSSPVIASGKIFITGYSGYAQNLEAAGNRDELTLHVLAYDLETGENLWDYAFPASAAEQEATNRIADHGYASPTPCTDGQAVYASFGPSGVVALDLQGNLLWKQDVGDGKAGFGAASSPIEFEDLVIVNASIESDTLFALDKKTGYVNWKVEGIERAWTTPAMVRLPGQPTELVIHCKDRIFGLDARTGLELWSCQGIPDYIVPVPVVHEDVVYFSGGRQNRTLAVRAGGRGDVTDSHKLWEVTKGANVTTPLFHENHLYWSHDQAFAQSLDAKTGNTDYQERFQNRDRVYASVVYGDGKLFMTQRDGTTLVLKAEPVYEELATNHLGHGSEQFNATPAIFQGSLIFRSTEFLYRIGVE